MHYLSSFILIDILLILETKLDDSFFSAHFNTPHRLDKNSNRVGFYYTLVKILLQDF